jgi:hypothetical protein
MNKQDHLILRLSEECVEVSKECHKALSFGIEDRYKRMPSVREKIVLELNDLFAVVEMLQDEGVLPMIVVNDRLIDAKKKKVVKFMRYAKKKGKLDK